MKRTTARAAMMVTAALAVVASTASCGSSSSSSSGSKAETVANVSGTGTVNAAQNSDWQTFDHQVNTPGLMWYETAGYDRLTAVYNGKVVPYLATSWTVASDNKQATFTLRKDAKCQDGTPVTPQVVANSFKRLFTVPKKGVNMTQDFGAGPWSVSDDAAKGTVTITLGTPFRGLLTGVASGEASIICPAGLAHPASLQTKWFGSGPYELVSAVHGSQVVLKKNPAWTWGPVVNGQQITAKDLPQTQNWKIIADPTTVANALLTGGLQVSRLIGPDLGRFANNQGYNVNAVPLNFPLTMSMQEGPGHPTSDGALRAALSTAVNPSDLNKAFNTQGGKLPPLATSFVNQWQECYDPKTAQLYPSGGIAAAKQILTKAGYTGIGSKLTAPGGKPVTLRIVTSPALVGDAGEYLLAAFKPLGANVQLTNTNDIATVTKLVYGGQQDVGVTTGQGSTPELVSSVIGYFFGNPLTQGGLNVYGPSPTADPEWNRLMANAFGSSDCSYWDQAQEYALTHHIMLPIAQDDWYVVAKTGVSAAPGYWLFEPWTIRQGS